MSIVNIRKLKALLNSKSTGILFCIGSSLVSRLIQAKTREYDDEIVPSHVAIIYKGFVYESQSNSTDIGDKTVPSGVRRLLLKDFLKSEKGKRTQYEFYPISPIDEELLEKYVHLPYGIDSIVDFLLRDKSDGKSKGLICSQYANNVLQILPDEPCPSPAQLFRVFNK